MSKDEDKKESKTLFGKLRFRQWNEVLQANRTPQDETKPQQQPKVETEKSTSAPQTTTPKTGDSENINIPKPTKTGLKVMIIPENVYIEGSVRGECDAEIYGKINGNILVKGNLILGKTAEVKGSIKALSSSIDGIVEGKIESTNDVEIGPNSKIQAELISGQRIVISGQVNGSVQAEIGVKLLQSAKLNGDIIALKWISVQEGAIFNGNCIMKKQQQQHIPQQSLTVGLNQNQQIKK
ncbi:MAG: polymer-forming cytoskeletal protein [Candidatus Hydrogenedens sp.]|nr:polymer-forming cytoskeletal protein [Candidatus Hydrogenedens sp.]